MSQRSQKASAFRPIAAIGAIALQPLRRGRFHFGLDSGVSHCTAQVHKAPGQNKLHHQKTRLRRRIRQYPRILDDGWYWNKWTKPAPTPWKDCFSTHLWRTHTPLRQPSWGLGRYLCLAGRFPYHCCWRFCLRIVQMENGWKWTHHCGLLSHGFLSVIHIISIIHSPPPTNPLTCATTKQGPTRRLCVRPKRLTRKSWRWNRNNPFWDVTLVKLLVVVDLHLSIQFALVPLLMSLTRSLRHTGIGNAATACRTNLPRQVFGGRRTPISAVALVCPCCLSFNHFKNQTS